MHKVGTKGERAENNGRVVNLITDVKEIYLGPVDPIEVFSKVRKKYPGGCFLLESADGSKRTARYSFIGFDPMFEFVSKGKTVRIDGNEKSVEDPYEELRKNFSQFRSGNVDFLPFSGGLVGYLGYEMTRFFEELPQSKPDELDLPDSHFMLPAYIICFDYINDKRYLISHGENLDVQELIKGPIEKEPLKVGRKRSTQDKKQFTQAVETAKQYIRTGDIFQTVLSRRIEVDYEGDELQMYRMLRDINPSPYMFFLDFPDTKIIGSSPEMLLRLEDGNLTTRPLAGTRHRSRDPEEDEKLKMEMLLDEKERAEHVMLVDLHRNDMGRVSEYGSVKVTELMGVEKYSHVQHIVSNVVSKLDDHHDSFDALRACFPAGTVSGAPKIRAMEIIDELEPVRRGPYAGVAGYFDFGGNCNFAINIRTIFTKGNKAYIQAGAGIVADSDPDREFIETENKMGAMLRALEVGTYG